MKIKTVGDLRGLLQYSDDKESLDLWLNNPILGLRNFDIRLDCDNAYSAAAGGRATVLRFNVAGRKCLLGT